MKERVIAMFTVSKEDTIKASIGAGMLVDMAAELLESSSVAGYVICASGNVVKRLDDPREVYELLEEFADDHNVDVDCRLLAQMKLTRPDLGVYEDCDDPFYSRVYALTGGDFETVFADWVAVHHGDEVADRVTEVGL